MNKLRETKKITLATLKSFARRNAGNIFCITGSSFNGMVDMVESVESEWKPTEINLEKTNYYRTGIQGIYTVGSSRDYFRLYEDDNFIGINVYNCCGDSTLAVKKSK